MGKPKEDFTKGKIKGNLDDWTGHDKTDRIHPLPEDKVFPPVEKNK